MTDLASDIQLFEGIPTRRGVPKVSHLFFGDDALFFFKASPPACQHMSALVSRFCDISGQIVNLQKSFLKFSPNIPLVSQDSYKAFMRMDTRILVGTYLGTRPTSNLLQSASSHSF